MEEVGIPAAISCVPKVQFTLQDDIHIAFHVFTSFPFLVPRHAG